MYSRSIILILITLAAFIQTEAQDFVIKNYEIELNLQNNGRLDVTEKIDVYFNKPRRGIIRSIPYRYRVDRNFEGEVAQRMQSGEYYHTLVKDLNVKDHQFLEYKSGDFVMVRIGDADVTIKGHVKYEITYSIWGVLNTFSQSVEFPFNVIGYEWDAPIEKANFKVNLAKPLQLTNEDVLVYTGHRGSRNADVDLTFSNQQIEGRLLRELKRNQGITLSIRFPLDYFDQTQIPLDELATRYWIDSSSARIVIMPDGSIEVTEFLLVEYKDDINAVEKVIKRNVHEDVLQQYIYSTDYGARSPNPDSFFKLYYDRTRHEDILRVSGASPRGSQKAEFTLQYRLWGCLVPTSDEFSYKVRIPISVLNGMEPTRSYNGMISAQDIPGGQIDFDFHHQLKAESQGQNSNFSFKLISPALFGVDGTASGVLTVTEPLDLSNVPNNIYAKKYFIEQNAVKVDLDKNGNASIEQSLDITFNSTYMNTAFQWHIDGLQSNIGINGEDNIQFNNQRLFSEKSRLQFKDVEFDTSRYDVNKQNRHHLQLRLKKNKAQEGYNRFAQISYKSSNLTYNHQGYYRLNIPVTSKTAEPVLRHIIQFDTNWIDERYSIFAADDNGRIYSDIDINTETGTIMIHESLRPGRSLFVSIPVKSDYVSISKTQRIQGFVQSNVFLIISVGLLFLIFMIYFLFGRDKKPIITASYYPPKGITSAEMGWLDDDRIRNRDLISLIYYWGSKGIIEIQEINKDLESYLQKQNKDKDSMDDVVIPRRILRKSDYRLTILKELPSDAKTFEKTMFYGLFKKRKSVTISSLKSQFHSTLIKTRKELEAYGKQRSFYVPGTRAFASFLIVCSVLALFSGLIAFGIGFGIKDQTYAVGLAILGVSLYFIGKYMPKKGRYGFKKYEKLLGFKTFIEMAEIDRLKALIHENPNYFSDTLPYAIAFGMMDEWSDKFEKLIVKPPKWYKTTYPGQRFMPIYFAQSIDNSLKSISKDLSTRPVSTSSGSGGSSFGGGFSSGGGFGGGGGSSW